ncbi:MAG: hypothetical protein AAGN64_00195, partial [Bacteroidota bacterium]
LYKTSKASPLRRKYFDALLGASARERHYFFDFESTAKMYQSTLRAIESHSSQASADIDQFDSLATQLVRSYLARKRTGLLCVSRFPDEFRYFTLGNGRAAFVSGRTADESESIGHGFFLRANASIVAGFDFDFAARSMKKMIPSTLSPGVESVVVKLVLNILSVAFQGIQNLTGRQRAQKAVDFGARIRESMKKDPFLVETLSLPYSRPSGAKLRAEEIIERVKTTKL